MFDVHVFAMREPVCTMFGTLQCRFVLNMPVNLHFHCVTKWRHLVKDNSVFAC